MEINDRYFETICTSVSFSFLPWLSEEILILFAISNEQMFSYFYLERPGRTDEELIVEHLILFFYCCAVVDKFDSSFKSAKAHCDHGVQSVLICVLGGYGGSVLNAWFLNQVQPLLVKPELILMMMFAWWIRHNGVFGNFVEDNVLKRQLFKIISGVSVEVFRSKTIFGWYWKALEVLPENSTKFIAPIICGTLGGCGGMFFPLSRGFISLDSGIPYNMETAFYCVVIVHSCRLFWPGVEMKSIKLFLCGVLVVLKLFPAFAEEYFLQPTRTLFRAALGLSIGRPRHIKGKTN